MFDPNNMKEYFRNIVTKRLDDAPVGPAKGELIEELAENLTCRYNDLVASGMEAHEAQDRALEALGDTAELVEYLKSLEPDQPLPELVTDPEKTDDGKLDDLLHNVEDLIRGALKKAKTAIGEAKENLKENFQAEAKATVHIHADKDLSDIEQEMSEVEEKVEALQEKMEKLEDQISEAEDAISELEDTRASLEELSEKVDVTHSLDDVYLKIKARQEEIRTAQQEIKDAQKEHDSLREAYDILESQYDTLEEQLDAEEELEELEDMEDGDTVTVTCEDGDGSKSWKFSMGYDSDEGKFYAGKGDDPSVRVGKEDIKSGLKDLMKNIEKLVREAADTAQGAVDKAAESVRKAADAAADADLGESVPVSDPIEGDQLRAIRVESGAGDITVRMTEPADGDVVIRGDSEDLDRLEVFRTDDGVLTVRPIRTETAAFFSRRGLSGSSVDVTLDLPCRDWESLELRSTGGDIRVTADRPIGELSVHTVSGDVTADLGSCPVAFCRTTGGDIRWSSQSAEFRAETVSGDVRFSGRADRFAVKTTSGDAELEGVADQVNVRTVSGDVWVRDGILPEELTVGTVSGDVKADLPDEGPFKVKFSSTSGDFRSDFFTGVMGGRSCQFSYQGGGDKLYTVSTVSGDLELRKGV